MNQPKYGALRKGIFNPKIMDTLKPVVRECVGKEFYFSFAWPIEEEDSEVYAGQDAYLIHPKEDRYSFPEGFTWCPEEDITWLTEDDDE